jgi:mannosyltransferase OCH1-like enzyme
MARNKLRLTLTVSLVFITLWIWSSSIQRIYYLLRLPFVWKPSSAEAVVSQQRDDFDLTFTTYGANYSTYGSGIRPFVPRRLHHIQLGSESPPKEWLAARAECLEHHEFWEARLWTDDNADSFVEENYPHLYDMWAGYPYQVQRVDALRYMVLEKYGGMLLTPFPPSDLHFDIHSP